MIKCEITCNQLAPCVHNGHKAAANNRGVLLDFVKCADDDALKNSIRFLNDSGWRLIAVTHDGVDHYLFFERPAYG